MSHVRMSHDSQKALQMPPDDAGHVSHKQKSHVTRTHESWHTYECVMTHRIASLPPDVVIYVLHAPHEIFFGIRRVSNPCTSIDPGSLKIGFLVLIQNAGFVRDNGTD